MPALDSISALAPAKLNLTLEVLGRRSDGFHEVRTVLQTIDLADRLVIQPSDTLSVECSDSSLGGEANLVWQAAVKLAHRKRVEPKAHISIEKNIPIAMGLGGGSSDAATALLALNRLWRTGLSRAELSEVAAQLGSDVPFFLHGGAALGQGRGEKVTPLPNLPPTTITLICPRQTIPNKTAQLYARLTPSLHTDGQITTRAIEILCRRAFVTDILYNVFEEVAFQVFPDLGELRNRVQGAVNLPLHLSGAGPALYVLPSNAELHQKITGVLQKGEAKAYLVKTLSPSWFDGVARQRGVKER